LCVERTGYTVAIEPIAKPKAVYCETSNIFEMVTRALWLATSSERAEEGGESSSSFAGMNGRPPHIVADPGLSTTAAQHQNNQREYEYFQNKEQQKHSPYSS
jgi:hypothetical protein